MSGGFLLHHGPGASLWLGPKVRHRCGGFGARSSPTQSSLSSFDPLSTVSDLTDPPWVNVTVVDSTINGGWAQLFTATYISLTTATVQAGTYSNVSSAVMQYRHGASMVGVSFQRFHVSLYVCV